MSSIGNAVLEQPSTADGARRRLDITIERGLSVAEPSGEVDVSTAPVPASPLAATTSEMRQRLVLDLSNHDLVGAAGLGAPSLLAAARTPLPSPEGR